MKKSEPKKKYIFLAPLFLLISCAGISADDAFVVQSERAEFVVTPVVGGLEKPWSIAFLPGNSGILISERTGALRLYRNGNLGYVDGVPEAAVIGQGGLLDIVLSPDFATDNMIYLSYAEAGSGGYGTAVARAVLVIPSTGNARLNRPDVIFRARPKSGGGIHFGSRLAFDSAGKLYITLGERGSMNRAQDRTDHAGSVVRINPDGTVPPDNPFVDDGNAADEIFTYGHRNAQGLAKNPDSGEMWLHEHGPKGGDEVNILKPGANYGWPLVSYGVNYDGSIISKSTKAAGIEDAIIYWVPSIAPSGMAFYRGTSFPEWRNSLFVGALAGQQLRRLEIKGNTVVHQEVLLEKRLGRIRDVRTGPDGNLYLITDADNGILYRISPAG